MDRIDFDLLKNRFKLDSITKNRRRYSFRVAEAKELSLLLLPPPIRLYPIMDELRSTEMTERNRVTVPKMTEFPNWVWPIESFLLEKGRDEESY